jgi:DNA-binding NtrC family response regulator
VLERHDWPGNVRELENAIHRQFVLSDARMIVLDEASLRVNGEAAPAAEPAVAFDVGFKRAKEQAIEAFERAYVRRALEESGGNVSAAARRAEKERRTFSKLLKKHGIDRRAYESR